MDSLALDAFDADLSDVDTPDLPDAEAPPAEDTPSPVDDTVQAADAEDEQPGDEVETETAEDDEKAKAKATALVAAAVKAKDGEAAKPADKVVKFKTSSGLVDVTETAEVDWKVDGKVEKVKVRDLLDNYAGKVSYDRKFQELSAQRKGFQEESQAFQGNKERHKALINDMHKAASEGRVFDAVTNMLEMTGLDKQVDAKKYVGELREALVKQAKALASMTPEQREIHDMREEQNHQNSKYQRLTQQREVEQAERAFHTRVTKAIESVKSTPAEFVQTRDFMLQHYKDNQLDPSKVTPEAIAAQIRDVRDYRIVQEAMEFVDPELVKNTALWEQTVGLMRANPSWTKEDVKTIFRKAVEARRSKAISSKVAKQPIATAAKAAVKSKTAKPAAADDFSSFSEADLSW